MAAPRFFVSGVYALGDEPRLTTDDARKMTLVLRKSAGDDLEIVDSSGRRYAASLVIDGDIARAKLNGELDAPAAVSLSITLAQGVPKGQKMEYVVEKTTELGISGVLAFTSSRTIGESTREGKIERWRRVAKSAAEQCGRSDVPSVDGPIAFPDVIARVAHFDRTLVPWELAPARPLRERLPSLVEGVRRMLVVIGPEGGLSESEVASLEAAGAQPISLGSRILRTETAGLVACAALFYASGDI